jgi:dephospho-CoA kinase
LGRSEKAQSVETVFWGLTGGVASGKSTVAKYFSEIGVPVVDADEVSRRLSAPGGAAFETIVKRFGTADRAKLREIVFRDSQARRDLEAILHPLILSESRAEMRRLASQTGAHAVLYEASLLIEAGRHREFAGLIVVESPRNTRKTRLLSRPGITDTVAEGILNSQITDEERRKAASRLIENNGTLDELREKVRQIALAARWISS